MLSTPEDQGNLKVALRVAKGAKAQDTDAQNEGYDERDTAQDQRTQSQIAMANDAGADAGMLYAKRVLEQAEASRLQKTAANTYVPQGDDDLSKKLMTLAQTKDLCCG